MRVRGPCPSLRPTPLHDVSPVLVQMVLLSEDARFASHHGIDWVELEEAVRAVWQGRGRWRGASTITQQVAKNLYLSPSRNPLRKVKEAVTAVRLEVALSKDRILELYLNVAEWGPGIWGVAAASEAYFGVPPGRLTEEQAAALAATLPHPRTSNPIFRPARMLARRDLILARYRGADVDIPPAPDGLDSLPTLPITVPPILPVLDSLLDSVQVRPDSDR